MIKNRLGCSIPFDYLFGKKETEFEAVFGSVDECLKLFSDCGVESVELRGVTTDTSAESLFQVSSRIRKGGLDVTIHGIIQKPPLESKTVPYLSLLPQDIVHVVTVHAYAGNNDVSLDEYKKKTVLGLKQMLRKTPSNILFALELNRKRSGRIDPGSTFQGVLEMVEAVDDSRLGICWDMGHTLANFNNGLSEMIPTIDFLKLVIHTHIHDVSDEGKTHFPLTCGRLPLRECVSALEGLGYNGIYNLELGVDHWPYTSKEKLSKMLKSLEIVKNAK